MVNTIIIWGSVASAITAIIVLICKVLSSLHKITNKFNDMQRHIKENYLNNLRLVIMSAEIPIEERLQAGEKYVKEGGNGQVKAFYKKLQEDYLKGVKENEELETMAQAFFGASCKNCCSNSSGNHRSVCSDDRC